MTAQTSTPTSTRLRLPFSPWHLVLIPMTFLLIVPLLWMLITSLETEGEANRFPPVLLPAHPRLQNYFRARITDTWDTASRIADLVAQGVATDGRLGGTDIAILHGRDDWEIPWREGRAR